MAFSVGDLPVGVGACDGVVQGGEGGEVQRLFEGLVASFRGVFAADG